MSTDDKAGAVDIEKALRLAAEITDPEDGCVETLMEHGVDVIGDLAGEVRSLRAKLAALLRYEYSGTHAHSRVATWDCDNSPPVGNAPCARCHAFAAAREAVGLPRWPTIEEQNRARFRRESGAEKVCDHPATCGCGASLRLDYEAVVVLSDWKRGEP